MADAFIRAQLEAMRYLDPGGYSKAVEEMRSMDRESYVARLREFAQEKGIDLDRMAMRYGIRL